MTWEEARVKKEIKEAFEKKYWQVLDDSICRKFKGDDISTREKTRMEANEDSKDNGIQ